MTTELPRKGSRAFIISLIFLFMSFAFMFFVFSGNVDLNSAVVAGLAGAALNNIAIFWGYMGAKFFEVKRDEG